MLSFFPFFKTLAFRCANLIIFLNCLILKIKIAFEKIILKNFAFNHALNVTSKGKNQIKVAWNIRFEKTPLIDPWMSSEKKKKRRHNVG